MGKRRKYAFVCCMSFILMYCKCANRFSKAITAVETDKIGNTDADYSTADALFKQKFFVGCLWGFKKFYKPETRSYFPKCPTGV